MIEDVTFSLSGVTPHSEILGQRYATQRSATQRHATPRLRPPLSEQAARQISLSFASGLFPGHRIRILAFAPEIRGALLRSTAERTGWMPFARINGPSRAEVSRTKSK